MPDETDAQDIKALLTEWSHWFDDTRIRMRKLRVTWEQLVRILDAAARDQQDETIGPDPDQRPPTVGSSGHLDPSKAEEARAS